MFSAEPGTAHHQLLENVTPLVFPDAPYTLCVSFNAWAHGFQQRAASLLNFRQVHGSMNICHMTKDQSFPVFDVKRKYAQISI